MHEPAPMGELLINKEVWDGLPEDLQALIHVAVRDTAARWFVWFHRHNAEAYQELTQKHGVQVYKTPDDIILTLLESWDKIAAAEAEKDPFFKKVLESQREYASLIVPYRLSTWPPYGFAGITTGRTRCSARRRSNRHQQPDGESRLAASALDVRWRQERSR